MMQGWRTAAAVGLAPLMAGVAMAAEEEDALKGRIEATGNVALVSDYRARGLTVSDRAPTVQGGFDIAVGPWSAGVWASGMERVGDATTEIDFYAARTVAIGDYEVAFGGTWFHYPNGDNLDYGEAATSVAREWNGVDVTAGVNYAWDQDALGDEDNLYVFSNLAAPAGTIAGAPLTVNASLGWEDGALAVEGEKLDWSLGLAADIKGVTLGVSWVGSDLDDEVGEAGAVVSLGKTF